MGRHGVAASLRSPLSSSLLLAWVMVLVLGLSATPAQAQKRRPAGTYSELAVRSTSTGALMAALPGTSQLLMIERPRGQQHVLTASVVDLATGKATAMQPPIDHFCGAITFTEDGDPLLVGGHTGSKIVKDGRKVISVFHRDTLTFERLATLTWNRWYPTAIRVSDREVLISGGTSKPDGGDICPKAEVYNTDTSAVELVTQPQLFTDAAAWNWFPFLALLPKGHVIWWGDTAGSITDGATQKLITDLPFFPDNSTQRTAYPYTGSPVLLPLTFEDNYEARFCIFGGAENGAKAATPASSQALCLHLKHCNSPSGYCFGDGWQVEDMGLRRVMGDTVALPNGKVLILNGAQNGRAGYANGGWKKGGDGSFPNTVSLLYDPIAPAGKRFKRLAETPIVRMYHSTACLHHTGDVLVAGCDVCAKYAGVAPKTTPSPDGLLEYRLQLVKLTENARERPAIVTAPKIITRGLTFIVDYEYSADIIGASLVTPCGVTHSIGMNQRVVMLKVIGAANGRAFIQAPPALLPALALRGHYLLFLLGKSRSYSEGVWLQLR
ncbi:hypothetical protein TSOC_007403 [Tetrabaena socialis]|uniref:Galactose oxidase n=1 Tax=Tetrabaena socialis TaxID=47790 RepID=A0A2J8A145_9CHLO|nr:hypothetical protein TSOC_007403 [Tetrabaena socialis]|eukprot:PNH06232.1 hypothetical protein TSOC_007403 [Tetrabaena socialis]